MKTHSSQRSATFFLLALSLSLLFVWTAHPFTYEQAVVWGFPDVIEYMAVATAPNFESLHNLSLAHAMHRLERWPLHFVVGRLAIALDGNVWELERVFVLLGMGLVYLLIASLRTGLGQKIAMFALLIFCPYTFRQYYAIPGMLSDCFFYVAILGLAVSMWKKQWLLLTFSLCCACFLRQTGVLLLPIVLMYCWIDRVHLSKAVLVLSFGCAAFGLSKLMTAWAFVPVSGGYVVMHTLGFFFWVVQNPQWLDFVDFFGRYVLMLLSLSPLLLLFHRLSMRDWMFIGFFFFLHTQPLLAGPWVSGSNVDRLAIYGLPFLSMILIDKKNKNQWIYLFITLIFLESLLPNFSILRGISYPRYFFVSIVICSCLISLAVYNLKHKNCLQCLN